MTASCTASSTGAGWSPLPPRRWKTERAPSGTACSNSHPDGGEGGCGLEPCRRPVLARACPGVAPVGSREALVAAEPAGDRDLRQGMTGIEDQGPCPLDPQPQIIACGGLAERRVEQPL